jgi:hypothetical protein
MATNRTFPTTYYPVWLSLLVSLVLSAVAAPTSEFLDVVQEVERDFGLPSPTLGGQWAKKSRAVKTSYLFTDLTEANADETIRFARLGGFAYIMTYDSAWSKSLGSYPINTNNFPGGEANVVLLHAEPTTDLSRPAAGAPMPGALAQRTDFAKTLDLLHHRALAVPAASS